MKITIVLGAFLPVPAIMGGAVEKVWFALGQEFAQRGHEVVQISRAVPQFPREEMIGAVKHLRVRGFDTPASLLWLKGLDLIYSLRARRVLPHADILITNTFWLPLLVKNSKRGKVYVHVARFPKGQIRFYKNAARLQTPSRAVAQAVAAEAPALQSRISVIPNPRPERTEHTEPPPYAKRAKKIIFVGRVHPEKGVHLLVEAFAAIPPGLANEWRLIVIGPTETRFGGGGRRYADQLREASERAGSKIELRGPIFDAATLEREFRDARLFIYPSLAETGESFGLAPLEAMTHRCAVLVSDLACFHDFIRDGETGFIFNHRAAQPANQLRQKTEKLLGDEPLLARVAEAGYQKSAEYSLTRVADQFLEDFKSLIEPSRAAPTTR